MRFRTKMKFQKKGKWMHSTVSCESGYWKFEKWKVKWKSGSLISRSEKWNENLVHSFREWKVKWKCLDIEIESEKWNENVSKSRSRVKSELKMPRDRDREVKFLENFREISRNSWESRNQENFKSCYKCFSFGKLLLWNTTKCYFWINMSQGILGMVLGWDMLGCVDGKFLLALQSSANSRGSSRGPSNPSSPVNLLLLNI